MSDMNRGEMPVSEDDAKRFGIMPIALIGDYVTIAVSNPYDVIVLDDIKLHVGKNVLPVVSTERAIQNCIENSYNADDKALEEFMENMDDDDDEDLGHRDEG